MVMLWLCIHFQLSKRYGAGERVKNWGEFRYFSSRSVIAVFFYCVISLALGQLGITGNTEVTRNGPRANWLLFHLSNSTFPTLQLNASNSFPLTSLFVSANTLPLSLRIKRLICLHRLILRKRLQESCYGWIQ